MGPWIDGTWSGIPNLLLSCFLGLFTIAGGCILAEIFGKRYAPFVIVGLMGGLQIMVSFTSSKFVSLKMGGVEMFIVAGSLMYPVLALGDDYLNEFYGPKIARASVLAQLIARALSTAFLIWLIFLPAPSFNQGNFAAFRDLMGIVPRVAISSMLASYIGGIIDVTIFDFVKRKTEGRMLWLRTFSSTIVGLFINAVLFTFMAFTGIVPFGAELQMIAISVTVRIVTAALEVVFLYGMKYCKTKGWILQSDEPILLAPLKN